MTRPGFLFMFGLYGTRATRESVSLLKDTGACGVMFLARNIESPAQLRRFVLELQDKVDRPLLFAVDHEGGWVLRFKSGVTGFPGNASLGLCGDPELAGAVGRRMGYELSSMGLRLNFAPVLDVLGPRYNPGIGMRSFGSDPALAGRLGAAFIRGMQGSGVSATAKHFPGKGAARQDAHLTLPTIRLPRAEFARVHLAPFREAVRAGVHCVMTSHVRFPALDPSGTPATFSSRITRRLLRGRLGFKGVVISDDLCMGAVTERMPIQSAASAALDSGHDILLIVHDPRAQREAAELLERAVQDGLVPPSRIEQSVRRIRSLMARHAGKDGRARPSGPLPPARGAAPARALALRIARGAVETVQRGPVTLPARLGRGGVRRLAVLLPDFAQVRERFTLEGGPKAPGRRLLGLLRGRGASVRLVRSPVTAWGPGGRACLRAARTADLVLFFCFEAMRFAGQARLLKELQLRLPRKLVVCLIRSSHDRSLLVRGVAAVDAHGYRDCSLEAALEAIFVQ